MKVYDKVNKVELEATTDELVKLMSPGGRQVDLILHEKKSDEDGYMSWDVEHWSSIDGKRLKKTPWLQLSRLQKMESMYTTSVH